MYPSLQQIAASPSENESAPRRLQNTARANVFHVTHSFVFVQP